MQAALAILLAGRTSFVVAHRLSTIRDADLVLVLDHGHIIERGRHDELVARGGVYHQLFRRFVQAARSLGMEVALDYALQCSPDHPWVREHPEWFFIRPDGTIKYAENPPKKYEDIYPINFWCDQREALWDACRDVFLFWIEQGVRTFRVDNPHTKPYAFWE